MKTDDLLVALAADTMPRLSVRGRMLRALPMALALSVGALVVIWGIRSDIGTALSSVAVLKTTIPLVLAALAGAFALALSQPDSAPQSWGKLLLLCAAALLLAFVMALYFGGVARLIDVLWRPSLVVCVISIPILAMPILTAVLWGLSAGAPTDPGKTGILAGIAAGGLATAVYTFYCDQDAALFYLPAYSAAMALVVLLGGAAGARVLKW